MRHTTTARLVSITIGAATLGLPARAAIIDLGGDLKYFGNPPSSLVIGDCESSDYAFVFDEQQGVTLPIDMDVDASEPGIYANYYDLTPAILPAGTVVNSHLIHFDPVGIQTARVAGWITFDQDILGVMVNHEALDASDAIVGWPDTTYYAGSGRKFDLADDSRDAFTLTADMRTLWVTMGANNGVDNLRIITVPGPAGLVLLVLGGLLNRRRRF